MTPTSTGPELETVLTGQNPERRDGPCRNWAHGHAPLRWVAALVLLLNLAPTADATPRVWTDPESQLDLAGPWKFQPGDDPAWADPGFPDDDWRRVEIPTGFGRNDAQAEIAWYRVAIVIRPASRFTQDLRQQLRLGVTVGSVDSAYEVFAGGQRLGGVGAMPPSPRLDYDRHATLAIPWQAVDSQGRLVLAFRVWKSDQTRGGVGGPHEGAFLLGRHEDLVRRELRSELPALFLAAIFLVVGLIHLELYRRRPQLREYLWLALTVIAFALYTFLRTQWKYLLTDDFVLLKESEHLLIYLLLATLVQCLWPLLGLRIGPLLRAVQGLSVATGLLVTVTPGLSLNILILPFFQYLVLTVIGVGTWAVFSQAWRRHPGARVIAVGAVINGALVFHDVLIDRGIILSPRLLPFGFAAFVIALVITLANRFGRVHVALEELDRLYELSLDMLCVVGTDGYFKRVNPAATRILGYSADELKARPLTEFVHPNDRAGTLARIEGLVQGEPVVDAEVRYLCHDGSQRWLSWRSTSPPGQDIIYGIARDITEKRRAAEALERANEARAEFLANMSHEIRTPMNAIVGLSNLLLKGQLPEEERSWTESVKASADGLLRIIDDILDFSKIEAGKLAIESVDFELREVLDSVIALLLPRAKSQGIELRLELSEDLPELLRGDPTRLRQVLLNLVGNAIKFTPDGHVALSVEIDDDAPEEGLADNELAVRFEVHDTGVGIPEDVLESLFSPFTQADSSTTRRYGGTGLGLAISQRIVEQQGGKIECQSTPGQGSTFSCTLPFRRSHRRTAEATGAIAVATAAPAQRRNFRILVAEDDEINRVVVLRVLSDLGYRAKAAHNGREVLEALGKDSFDLLLLDCQMPVLDGYETARSIRRDEAEGARLPIIAVTAHALKGERERCLAAGMDDYISKPFTEDQLAAAIDHWLREPVPTAPEDSASEIAPSEIAPSVRPSTLEIFLRQGPGKLEDMHEALKAGDIEALSITAHGLVGNAGFIGASRLARLCRNLEKAARKSELERCREHLSDIDREYRLVAAELEAKLWADSAASAKPQGLNRRRAT